MTDSESAKTQEDMEYNKMYQEILEIVSKYTFFPTQIVHSQFKRIKKPFNEISYDDIPRLAQNIGEALGSFTADDKGAAVRQAILQLRKN
ncbi:hypothetical protein KAR34_05765 [bacterium]|nr:hypothetical protein [bacterium]